MMSFVEVIQAFPSVLIANLKWKIPHAKIKYPNVLFWKEKTFKPVCLLLYPDE